MINNRGGILKFLYQKGQIINDKYQIIDCIGQGGFGEVYKVETLSDKTICALKTCINDDGNSLLRFKREVKVMKGVQHKNVMPVFDSFFSDDLNYFTMPYGDFNFTELPNELKIAKNIETLIIIFKEICMGVCVLHEKNIIHRDIKPHNCIYIHEIGFVVSDMGLCRDISSDSNTLSSSKYGIGSLFYMAPEQKMAAKNASFQSDIYSLGKLLYYMITGIDPEFINLELVPDKLKNFIHVSTSNYKENRHTSVREMIDELNIILESLKPDFSPENELNSLICKLKKSNLNKDEIIRCYDLISTLKNDKIFFKYFDEIPTNVLETLLSQNTEGIELCIAKYFEFVKKGKHDFDYVDTITDNLLVIYKNIKNVELRFKAFEILLNIGTAYNRFYTKRKTINIITSCKNDFEAQKIAQVIQDNGNSYGNIINQIEEDELHQLILSKHKEINNKLKSEKAERNNMFKGIF